MLLVSVVALELGGCASPNLSIRRLPSETPAADNAAARARAEANAHQRAAAQEGSPAFAPLKAAEAPPMYSYDPWERMNRFTYRFNARFDEAIFLPVANSYRRIPSPVRAGVHNFFDNLSEPKSIVNDALQLRPRFGLLSLGRLLINSTLGVGGLFDIATKLDLRSEATGFSATLSRWGLHPGPYLVIPVLGPSTLRDGIGLLGDYGASHTINVANLYRGNAGWALGAVYGIDQRANTDFRYYASGSPFEYEVVRFLYVHKELIEDQAQHGD